MRHAFIDDPADARLADYRDVRERDLVGRRASFVIEGEVVLRRAVRSGRVALRSVLLGERRLAGLQDLFGDLAAETAVYVATQAAMDAIVGFPIHRGVLAIGRRPVDPDPDAVLGGCGARALVLAMSAIANHDNMGGLLRDAAAFGVDAVLIDNDCCDPLYRKAIRVSVGAALTLPLLRLARAGDLLDALERHGFEVAALTPRGATPLRDLARAPRAALLVGAEGPGLPAEVLQRVRGVAIPMAAGFDSLNVAVAAALGLHHLSQVAVGVGPGSG